MSALRIGTGLVELVHSWTELKATLAAKRLLLQWVEDAERYSLFALEASVLHTATLFKAGASAAGIPEANDVDRLDFELYFRDDANAPLDQRALDGRLVTRTTIASPTRRTHQRAIYLKTSDPTSLVCVKPDGTPYNDITYGMVDADGDPTSIAAEAVQTFVDLEAEYDQELVGGCFFVDPTLVGGVTDLWWAAAIAVPHIPEEYGGSIAFLSRINLELIPAAGYRVDGRSTQFLPVDPVYHSNRIRFAFFHPAGESKRFSIVLESFR